MQKIVKINVIVMDVMEIAVNYICIIKNKCYIMKVTKLKK